MNKEITRIALIGPESSGKSELCRLLAKHYQTVWVQEYSREYLSRLTVKYSIEDIVSIYKTQYEQEQWLINKANDLIFIDTEFINARVWCEEVFGSCPKYISAMELEQNYKLYLLTSPDLPWVKDPLRENPGKGTYFFNRYKAILDHHRFDYSIISGQGETRLQNAVFAIDQFLSKVAK